jgi:hypothetical protein
MLVVRVVLVSALIFDAALASAAQLTAAWTDNSGGAASTQIDRKRQTDASFTTLADVPPGISTYVDAAVSEGITYCYRVKAHNAFGESPFSETACATPTPSTYTVSVSKTGTGSGTVASNPTGISCGSDCNELYTAGRVVTLAATAAPGSRFDGWSGGGCSGTGSCTISGNATATVTATFTVLAAPAPTPAPTPTPTPPPVASPTPTPTPTPVASPTPTPTPTPVASPTPTPTPTPVASPTPTPTPTPVASPTPTPTATPTTTTTTTSTSDPTPVTTTSTPQSLVTAVQSYVSTLAPYRIMAQLKDYLLTPAATAAPTPAPAASAPVIEPLPAPEPPPAMTAMVTGPPATARPVPPPRWTPPSPVDGRTTHRLVARFTARTWIKVRMDNGQVNRENVRAGAVRQWVSNGRFLVSIGNASAVKLELNGRPVPALGEGGAAVSDVVLPPDQ